MTPDGRRLLEHFSFGIGEQLGTLATGKQLTNPKLGHSPEPLHLCRVSSSGKCQEEIMGFGRGALLWLIGIPLPIILILALFMHH
jgi:hypothetical protein